MNLTRRRALRMMGCAAPALALGPKLYGASIPDLTIAEGKFKGTRDSLKEYAVPDWYRDAKFGIWSHWGPQSAIEDGDWYARNMYIEGSDQYKYHLATYGHPSKVGYKDLMNVWKADKWEPEQLMALYKKAGAKYFFSMGVHHDNFDLWNSKYQRWNAVQMGPKKDVVGIWAKAARSQGLKFGVSEHLWISYKWFSVSHWTDQTGPLAGAPYDGVDPKFADLYHDEGCERFAGTKFGWTDDDTPAAWKQHYFNRIKDLVDNYQPDLLYTDGHLPFEEYGLGMVANLYNVNARQYGGQTQAVYFSKDASDCQVGTCALDRERGVLDGISENPWQTDTCIGEWHYKRGERYKSAKTVIDLLVDIVSKNGNLLLNFPLPNSGQLDPEELTTLAGITDWMAINSEGIHATRPWKMYGDGPSTRSNAGGEAFNEGKKPPLGPSDVRFTTKANTLYAFVMGWPEKEAVIAPLGTSSPQRPGKVANVQLLGRSEKLPFKQEEAGLRITLPDQKLSEIGHTFKINFA